MIKKSYTFNYIKIYLWQGLSVFLNIVSMFVVVPRISSVPAVYGIYTLCISLTMFLNYADFGFLGAALKIGSESYARDDLESEIKVVGFINFLLLSFTVVFFVGVLYISFDPHLLINNIRNSVELDLSRKLLLSLAVFSFVIILQRIITIILGIRLEDYLFQRFSIIGSIIKIISVLYFFRSNQYDIWGYFNFSQVINVIVVLASLVIIKRRYNYDLIKLLRYTRYSKECFNSTKKLAMSSFYITIMWVLYYELDSIAIVKLLGTDKLALYSIALIVMSFFRTSNSIVYSPFQARFNHFVGTNDNEGLLNIYIKSIIITLPLCLFPVIIVTNLAEPLVLSWVGTKYYNSISLVQLLILSFTIHFIAQPTNILLYAKEKYKSMYVGSTLAAIIYWIGIYFTYNRLQLNSFALFKMVAFMTSGIYYLLLSIQQLNINTKDYAKKIFLPALAPSIILVLILRITRIELHVDKNIFNLLNVICLGIMSMGIATILYYYSSEIFRVYIKSILIKLKNKDSK